MTDFGLFAEREPARAESILINLDRHATRRDDFIDALDFDSLDTATQREICMEDQHIDEALHFGPFTSTTCARSKSSAPRSPPA